MNAENQTKLKIKHLLQGIKNDVELGALSCNGLALRMARLDGMLDVLEILTNKCYKVNSSYELEEE